MSDALPTQDLVAALKAAAEPTRLRILVLLSSAELNVKDLTQILGQSQPRISRHLKLLAEAGLVERYREGSWVYFHVSDRTEGGRLTRRLLSAVDGSDPVVRRDRERATALKREREQAVQGYFQHHAADWDRLRALHVPEKNVEDAMLAALGPGRFKLLLDLGTGTGRTLELFSQRFERGIGLDLNQSMLAYARSKLAAQDLNHAQVRHGDLYNLPFSDAVADAVIMHQVLHYLADPAAAISEAARVLAPGGRLMVVDFAPHDLEFLRDHHAHERLGFAASQIQNWFDDAGLRFQTLHELRPVASAGEQKLTVFLSIAERLPQNLRTQSRQDYEEVR
jgi:ubiquinone/menaquinone biosynthesis C-methylase UbiE